MRSSAPAGTNWAGNHRYAARELLRPASVEQLQEIVAGATRIRALGSRHSFTDLADTSGVLVTLDGLGDEVVLDTGRRRARVPAGATYGAVALQLHEQGWALASMASLPHISVAGAVATGTHGSGDGLGSLARSVRALEIVGADGQLRSVTERDPDLPGSVVALGALGIVTAVDLDIEPAFEVAQTVYVDVPWARLEEEWPTLTAGAYSVSVFTDWLGDGVSQVWVKRRRDAAPAFEPDWPRADGPRHMLAGAPLAAVTEQLGVWGPWHERLPHFRREHTPSRGEEVQSEYLLPRAHAAHAIEALRGIGRDLTHVLQVSELRTVAADDLWLSPAYGGAQVAIHFTWMRDTEAVYAVLGVVEERLLALRGRPHWGKCFRAESAELSGLYPRFEEFRALRRRVDPTSTFGNAFLQRTLAG